MAASRKTQDVGAARLPTDCRPGVRRAGESAPRDVDRGQQRPVWARWSPGLGLGGPRSSGLWSPEGWRRGQGSSLCWGLVFPSPSSGRKSWGIRGDGRVTRCSQESSHRKGARRPCSRGPAGDGRRPEATAPHGKGPAPEPPALSSHSAPCPGGPQVGAGRAAGPARAAPISGPGRPARERRVRPGPRSRVCTPGPPRADPASCSDCPGAAGGHLRTPQLVCACAPCDVTLRPPGALPASALSQLTAHAPPPSAFASAALRACAASSSACGLCFRCEGQGQDGAAGAGLSAHQGDSGFAAAVQCLGPLVSLPAAPTLDPLPSHDPRLATRPPPLPRSLPRDPAPSPPATPAPRARCPAASDRPLSQLGRYSFLFLGMAYGATRYSE
ncbi:hypothetical protein P7K49_005770 [Saguinus oedipus]|uniref:Uncharacterized protein n=1 Tax=Saguinus oedipus TaxID=9490 RepID=A0ABQ9W0J8_SAGOE|nr:hypothetical protein P7K49_005770 [Saguinus oedipus]